MTAKGQPEREAWARVYHEVDRRRAHLEMSWKEMERRGAPSANKLRAMRDGVPLEKDDKRHALCRVLRWEPGSVEEVLAGRVPRPKPPVAPGSDEEVLAAVRDLEDRLAVLEAQFEALERPGDR